MCVSGGEIGDESFELHERKYRHWSKRTLVKHFQVCIWRKRHLEMCKPIKVAVGNDFDSNFK